MRDDMMRLPIHYTIVAIAFNYSPQLLYYSTSSRTLVRLPITANGCFCIWPTESVYLSVSKLLLDGYPSATDDGRLVPLPLAKEMDLRPEELAFLKEAMEGEIKNGMTNKILKRMIPSWWKMATADQT